MGTTCCGRYLNTKGSKRKISEFAVVHANEGDFVRTQIKKRNGKPGVKLRLGNGGHGQKGMDLLDKYKIEFQIEKTYRNGVRVGCVPNHKSPQKRKPGGQTWFPRHWTVQDIKKAGEHVARLRKNRNLPDGAYAYGIYRKVRVGIVITNGRIATVFPDRDQSGVYKAFIRRRKRKNDSQRTSSHNR